jgi:hypothetical protein
MLWRSPILIGLFIFCVLGWECSQEHFCKFKFQLNLQDMFTLEFLLVQFQILFKERQEQANGGFS